jgi:hypothetical protein
MLNGIDMWNNTSSKLYSHQLSLSLMNHAKKKKRGKAMYIYLVITVFYYSRVTTDALFYIMISIFWVK